MVWTPANLACTISDQYVLMTVIIVAIRQLEPCLAAASQSGPTIVGGVRCSVDSSGEVTITIIIITIV